MIDQIDYSISFIVCADVGNCVTLFPKTMS